MADGLHVEWLGRVPYGDALARQARAVEARRAGVCGDQLLLVEHPPVVTLGRSAREVHLRTPRAALAARGVEVHEVARGGDVTWHGPGQLVGYLIVDLAARGLPDAHAFLRSIEAGLVGALADLGVAADARPGTTGVFVAGSAPPRKLASIGVGLRGWVSWHGFALNVGDDLGGFDAITPCGIAGVQMTSVAREGGSASLDAARDAVLTRFVEAFDYHGTRPLADPACGTADRA
jgi:lipoate-protein ligase B